MDILTMFDRQDRALIRDNIVDAVVHAPDIIRYIPLIDWFIDWLIDKVGEMEEVGMMEWWSEGWINEWTYW